MSHIDFDPRADNLAEPHVDLRVDLQPQPDSRTDSQPGARLDSDATADMEHFADLLAGARPTTDQPAREPADGADDTKPFVPLLFRMSGRQRVLAAVALVAFLVPVVGFVQSRGTIGDLKEEVAAQQEEISDQQATISGQGSTISGLRDDVAAAESATADAEDRATASQGLALAVGGVADDLRSCVAGMAGLMSEAISDRYWFMGSSFDRVLDQCDEATTAADDLVEDLDSGVPFAA